MTRQRLGWIFCLALFASASPLGLRARGDEKVEKADEKQKKQKQRKEEKEGAAKAKKSILQFKVKDIDGRDVALRKYRGEVLLVINVASQ